MVDWMRGIRCHTSVSVWEYWVSPHHRLSGERTDEVRHGREGKILLSLEMQGTWTILPNQHGSAHNRTGYGRGYTSTSTVAYSVLAQSTEYSGEGYPSLAKPPRAERTPRRRAIPSGQSTYSAGVFALNLHRLIGGVKFDYDQPGLI